MTTIKDKSFCTVKIATVNSQAWHGKFSHPNPRIHRTYSPDEVWFFGCHFRCSFFAASLYWRRVLSLLYSFAAVNVSIPRPEQQEGNQEGKTFFILSIDLTPVGERAKNECSFIYKINSVCFLILPRTSSEIARFQFTGKECLIKIENDSPLPTSRITNWNASCRLSVRRKASNNFADHSEIPNTCDFCKTILVSYNCSRFVFGLCYRWF